MVELNHPSSFKSKITKQIDFGIGPWPPRNVQVDDGPDSFELQATGPTFLNVAMKDTVLHEEPWHGGVSS